MKLLCAANLISGFYSLSYLSYQEPEFQKLNCLNSPFTIFDPTKVLKGCNSCPLNIISLNNETCSCATGVRQINCISSPLTTCAPPQIKSLDGTFCTTCTAAGTFTTSISGVATTLCACDAGSIFSDRDPVTGLPLATGLCTPCPAGHYTNQDISACIPCSDTLNMVANYSLISGTGVCQCRTTIGFTPTPLAGKCVLSTNLGTSMTLYGSSPGTVRMTDSSSISSDTFNKYFLYAVTNCDVMFELNACQVLANLCTMALYVQSQAACAAYRTIARKQFRAPALQPPFTDQPNGLPWLYWGLLNGETSIQLLARVPNVKISTSGTESKIKFMVGVYQLNGTFNGFQKLSTQFQLCSGNEQKLEQWNQAGLMFSNTCSLDLTDTFGIQSSTMFYELFVVQEDGSLYPVPVRIMNAESGPDPYPTTLSLSTSSYYRRFTFVDRVTGLQGGDVSYIRIPTIIQFWFRPVVGGTPGQIHVPVMDITYNDYQLSLLPDSVSGTKFSIPVSYTSTYISDYTNAYNAIQIILAIFGSFVVIFSFFQARSWNQRNTKNGPDALDLQFFWRFFLNLCQHLSTCLFWFLFALSFYLLIFYKTQGVLFVILPTYPVDTSAFSAGVGIVTAMEALHVTQKLFAQCEVDIFFIDWEQAKMAPSENPYNQPKQVPVSIWRSIFMSNEWAKLQSYRFCNIMFSLIGVLILLEGFSWKNAGTAKPNLYDLSDGNMNPILLFSIDILSWSILIVGQKLFHYIFFDRYYRDHIAQFIDIMSLANISLLLFDEKCHGFYIHGQSVHSTADTNLEELNNFLQKEANDMVPRRGLLDSNQQSFEVFITHEFRDVFDKIYRPTEGDTARTMMMMNKLSMVDGSTPKFQEYRSPTGTTPSFARTYKVMTKFLHAFFDMNLKEFPFSVKQKTFIERTFGASPDIGKGSVLMQDTRSITNCLLLGLENDLLILYMALFTYIHITSFNSLNGALAVWIIDVAISFIRTHMGEKNITQKALLDAKFLI